MQLNIESLNHDSQCCYFFQKSTLVDLIQVMNGHTGGEVKRIYDLQANKEYLYMLSLSHSIQVCQLHIPSPFYLHVDEIPRISTGVVYLRLFQLNLSEPPLDFFENPSYSPYYQEIGFRVSFNDSFEDLCSTLCDLANQNNSLFLDKKEWNFWQLSVSDKKRKWKKIANLKNTFVLDDSRIVYLASHPQVDLWTLRNKKNSKEPKIMTSSALKRLSLEKKNVLRQIVQKLQDQKNLTLEQRNIINEATSRSPISSYTDCFTFQQPKTSINFSFYSIPILSLIPFFNLEMKCTCLLISKSWQNAIKQFQFWTIGELFQWSIQKRNNNHLRGIYNANQRNLYFISPNIISTQPPPLSLQSLGFYNQQQVWFE